jgi:hypothetical protein
LAHGFISDLKLIKILIVWLSFYGAVTVTVCDVNEVTALSEADVLASLLPAKFKALLDPHHVAYAKSMLKLSFSFCLFF